MATEMQKNSMYIEQQTSETTTQNKNFDEDGRAKRSGKDSNIHIIWYIYILK